MTREEALSGLTSTDMHERLRSSRYFTVHATPADRLFLEDALHREDVSWIRARLRAAVAKARGELISDGTRPLTLDSDDEGPVADIFAAAVEETTRRLLHEIGPIAGAVRFYAQKEILGFDASSTRAHLDRLADLLEAIRKLSEAASTPVMKPFDLAQEARNTGQAVARESERVKITYRGPDPMVVTGDRELVELVLANGIRNAVEATEKVLEDGAEGRVIVSWDDTPEGPWLAVHDEGPGPPASADKAFEVGTSTKDGHLGMGLAIARQAVTSMGGKVSLGPSGDGRGARFFFTWPPELVRGEA